MRNKVVPNTSQHVESAQTSSLVQPEFVDGCEVFSPECICESNENANRHSGEESTERVESTQQEDAQLPSEDEAFGALGRRGIHRYLGGASREEHAVFHKEHHLANIVGLVSSREVSSSAREFEQSVQRKRKLNAAEVLSSTKLKRPSGLTSGLGASASWLDESVGTSGSTDVAGELLEQTSKRKVQSELGRWAYNTLKCCICADRLQLNEQSVEIAAKAFSEHPVLGVACCFKCVRMYLAEMATDRFTPDSDGNHTACTWCACGGKLALCDVCPRAFCKKCLRSQMGRTYSARFDQMDEKIAWRCLVCQPPPELQTMQVNAHEMLEAVRRENERLRERKATKTLSVSVAKRVEEEPPLQGLPVAAASPVAVTCVPVKNRPKARPAKSRSARPANRKLASKAVVAPQVTSSVVLYDLHGNAYCMVQPAAVHAALDGAMAASFVAPSDARIGKPPANQSLLLASTSSQQQQPIASPSQDDKECQQAICISSACILRVETTLAQLRELSSVISNTSLPLPTRRKHVRRFFTLLSAFVRDLGDVDSLEAEGQSLMIPRYEISVNSNADSLSRPIITVSNVMSASKVPHLNSADALQKTATTAESAKALFDGSNFTKSSIKQVTIPCSTQMDLQVAAESANIVQSTPAAVGMLGEEDCIVLDDSDDEPAACNQSALTPESTPRNVQCNAPEAEKPTPASTTLRNRKPDSNEDQSDEDLFSIVGSDHSVSPTNNVPAREAATQVIQSPAPTAPDLNNAGKREKSNKKRRKVLLSDDSDNDNRVENAAKSAASLPATSAKAGSMLQTQTTPKNTSESNVVLQKRNSSRNQPGHAQSQLVQPASPVASSQSEICLSPSSENANLETLEAQTLGLGEKDATPRVEPASMDGLSYYNSKMSGWEWRKPSSHITKALTTQPHSLLRSCGIALSDFRKQYPSVRMTVKGMTVKLEEWDRATGK